MPTINLPVSGEIGWATKMNTAVTAVNSAADNAVAKGDLVVNVKDYGAVGDAVTDDSAAIQAAINACTTAGGGRVFIPAGNYLLGSTLTLTSGVTLQGQGQRVSNLRVTSLSVNAVTILGASAGSTIVQCRISNLKITGPGKTSGGTGVGIYIKWASVDIEVDRCWITSWGANGIYAEDSYSMSFIRTLLDSNGANGFSGVTNINNITFDRTIAINNAGSGYKVVGGTTNLFLNSDAESNGAYGYDLRYVTAPTLLAAHCENNVSGSIYLHYRTGTGEKTTAARIMNCLLQGSGVTPTGVSIDGASTTFIDGCWFSGNTAEHIKTTSNTDRTLLGRNTFIGSPTNGYLVDGSASTAIIDYDYTNLIPRVSPGLLFAPRSTNPPQLAQGEVWVSSTSDQIKYRDATVIRDVLSGFKGSATLDFPSIASGGTADLTVAVTNAALGDLATAIPPAALEAGLGVERCWVSSAGVVTIRLRNFSGGAIDPASAGWKVVVTRY